MYAVIDRQCSDTQRVAASMRRAALPPPEPATRRPPDRNTRGSSTGGVGAYPVQGRRASRPWVSEGGVGVIGARDISQPQSNAIHKMGRKRAEQGKPREMDRQDAKAAKAKVVSQSHLSVRNKDKQG